MIEGIPIGLLDGLSIVGVVLLLALMLWRALTVVPKEGGNRRLPRLVTGREAESYLERAEKAEAAREAAEGNVAQLTGQNAQLMAFAELGRSTFTALRSNAEGDRK